MISRAGILARISYERHLGFVFEGVRLGTSFRLSFGPYFAWGSIETTSILTTHPSLHLFYLSSIIFIRWLVNGQSSAVIRITGDGYGIAMIIILG